MGRPHRVAGSAVGLSTAGIGTGVECSTFSYLRIRASPTQSDGRARRRANTALIGGCIHAVPGYFFPCRFLHVHDVATSESWAGQSRAGAVPDHVIVHFFGEFWIWRPIAVVQISWQPFHKCL